MIGEDGSNVLMAHWRKAHATGLIPRAAATALLFVNLLLVVGGGRNTEFFYFRS